MPEGTPNYGAAGTIATCTAEGFMAVTVDMTVPIYYGSLVLQAFMGMKNNFKELKYRWIEKWIHVVAWGFPLAVSTVLAATENINPSGSRCWHAQYPKGCEGDPNIDCERGKDIGMFTLIVGLSQVFLYFVYPPSVIATMFCWIRKLEKKKKEGNGMNQVREATRKEMLISIAKQISLYLLSFWSTFVLGLISTGYELLSGGKFLYNLAIVANSVYAFQGFVFMIVYFKLEKMGRQKAELEPIQLASVIHRSTYNNGGMASDLSVMGIRSRVATKAECRPAQDNDRSIKSLIEKREITGYSNRRRKSVFNIFDGIPAYRDSPWAQFIMGEYESNSVIDRNESGIFICTEVIHMENESDELHILCMT